MSKLGGWRAIGKIDKIRGLPDVGNVGKIAEIGGVEMARTVADDLDAEFADAVSTIGEELAREAQGLRRRGAQGTIPELLTESWLLRRRVPFVKQVSIPEASARVDFIVRDELAWRIQGEAFHPASSLHDRDQKYALRLMGFTAVDIHEFAIYHAREYALSAALRGREIGRSYSGITIQRGVTRRQ